MITADLGIAMSTGTDVAIQSAGMTLLGGDLGGVYRARCLGQAAIRNLFPAFALLMSPIVASAAMSARSVSVIVNALRLRRFRVA